MNRIRNIAIIGLLTLGIWTAGCGSAQIPSTLSPVWTSIPTDVSTPMDASTPQPGLAVRGSVHLKDGPGLGDVKIFLALASYAGKVTAVTDSHGDYQGEFQFIPGDEMIRVWAELDGYVLVPEGELSESGEYSWRHYFGFETRVLNFIAQPSSG